MSGFNRRDLFVGAGGVFAAWLTRRRASAAAPIPPAPVARVAVVKDTYFGETLSDPYRWMENDKDPDWLPFLRGQNEHTRAVLNTIPGREQLLKRIQQLSGDAAATRRVMRAGGKLFIQQRPVAADNFKLFVQENGVSRVLIDPTTLSGPTSHMSLDADRWLGRACAPQPSPSVRSRTYARAGGAERQLRPERWLHECAAAYRSGHGFETASLIKERVMPDDTVTTSWKRLTDKVKETSRAGLRRLSPEQGAAPSSPPAPAETAPLATWEDEGGTTSSRLQVPLRKS